VRRVVATALSLAIQAAALSAPLVHAHPDGRATAHHGGRTVHTHWAGHSHAHSRPDDPALETDDHDRATPFGAFIAVGTTPLPAIALAPSSFTLPVPAERAAHPNVDVAHGHDPPHLRSLPPRAPPAFPVLT
jgi:hypothetical protein